MTLEHVFIAWVCVTLYLCVIFLYELWRYRTGYYDVPKPVAVAEPPTMAEFRKAPPPRSEPARAPIISADDLQAEQVPQGPVVDRDKELMSWLMDHKKRDPADELAFRNG